MKAEQFTKICDYFRVQDSKLQYVEFIKEATQCGLKRAKCQIADFCFDDPVLDPYDLLTPEEQLLVSIFKHRKGTYSEQKRTSSDYSS